MQEPRTAPRKGHLAPCGVASGATEGVEGPPAGASPGSSSAPPAKGGSRRGWFAGCCHSSKFKSCHEQTLFPAMRTLDSLAVFQRLVFSWALSLQPISSFIHTLSNGIFSTSFCFFPCTTCTSSSIACDKCKPGCTVTAPLGGGSRSPVWKSAVQNLLALREHSLNF